VDVPVAVPPGVDVSVSAAADPVAAAAPPATLAAVRNSRLFIRETVSTALA
jgi:hypothetical protein